MILILCIRTSECWKGEGRTIECIARYTALGSPLYFAVYGIAKIEETMMHFLVSPDKTAPTSTQWTTLSVTLWHQPMECLQVLKISIN